MKPLSLPPPVPPPVSPPAHTTSDAAINVLANPSLLRLIVSFQGGDPIAFKAVLRAYSLSGFQQRGPHCQQDYAEMPHGDRVRIAHAIGFCGSTRHADALLRVWRGTGHLELLHEIAFPALQHCRIELVGWLLSRRNEIPGMNDAMIDELVRFATRCRVWVLWWFEARLPIDRIRRAIRFDEFEAIAAHDSPHALHSLAERDIRPTDFTVQYYALPSAIGAARRSVVEYLMEATSVSLAQISPHGVGNAIERIDVHEYTNYDHDVAQLLAWAVDDHNMAFDIYVVRALIGVGAIAGASVLVSRREQARDPFIGSILTVQLAGDLLEKNNTPGIELVVEFVDDIRLLAGLVTEHHARTAVALVRDAAQAHGILRNFRWNPWLMRAQ